MGYDNNNNSPFVNITGLWRSKDGQGLNGSLGGARIIIYKNKYKQEDRHPDYMLAVVEGNKDRGGNKSGYNQGGGGGNRGGGYNQSGNAPAQQDSFGNQQQGGGDDLPF